MRQWNAMRRAFVERLYALHGTARYTAPEYTQDMSYAQRERVTKPRNYVYITLAHRYALRRRASRMPRLIINQ